MFYSALLLLFMAHLSLSEDYYKYPIDYNRICRANNRNWVEPVCLADDSSGYFKVLCQWDWKKSGWSRDKPKPFTKCTKGKKCACDGYPNVPQYGLLTYTGSQYGDSDGPFRDPIYGKTAKDENGRYYSDFKGYIWGSSTWLLKQKFELILPKDGGFVKYTGWHGNKNCKEIFPHGPAGPLFQTYRYHTAYKKISEVHQRGDNYIQKWYHQSCDNEDLCDDATYTYIYNKATKISIPLKYHHFHQYDSADRTDEYNYVYVESVEDESIFDLSKYCTKFY